MALITVPAYPVFQKDQEHTRIGGKIKSGVGLQHHDHPPCFCACAVRYVSTTYLAYFVTRYNRFEAAPLDYLEREQKSLIDEIGDYKAILRPRDNGPFITAKHVAVGQWGMIRPGSPTRIAKDAGGRPLMTNNARTERMATAPTYRDAWKHSNRCLIPALSYNEPYWGTGKNIWWKFRRDDGSPWLLAGLWSEWTDRASGEVVPNYTMLTQNCDAHPLLKLFHKPDPKLPPDEQDKRAVVPIERANWEQWLSGTIAEAQALIKLPALDTFAHRAADPAKSVLLPIEGA